MKRFLFVGLIFVLLTAFLAGCGGGGDEPTPDTTVEPGQPGDQVLRLLGGNPYTLDPHLAWDAGSAGYIVEIFSGLVTISPKLEITLPDGTVQSLYPEDDLFWELYPQVERIRTQTLLGIWGLEDPMWEVSEDGETYSINVRENVLLTMEIVPDLAESWEISEDGTVYTFHLREGLTFSNMRPLTAEDFKFSIERACDPETASAVADTYLGDVIGCRAKLNNEAGEVDGAKVINSRTLELTIGEPIHYFLAKLTYPTAFAVEEGNVATDRPTKPWTDNPVGSGPFRLERYVEGEELILVPNFAYWRYQEGLETPGLSSIKFTISGGTPIVLYETDQVDQVAIGLQDFEQIIDPANPLHGELAVVREISTYYIAFNANQPPLDDPKVRRALIMATDRKKGIRVVLRGIIAPAAGIVPPDMPGYESDIQIIPYDPQRALELIAESKYGSVENLPELALTVPGGGGGAPPSLYEKFIEDWRQIGIEVDYNAEPYGTFLDNTVGSAEEIPYQMWSGGWIADWIGPENFLELLFHSESELNRNNYENVELDAILDEARTEKDPARRLELYRKAEEIIMEDLPWMPTAHSMAYILTKPQVKGMLHFPTVIPHLRFARLGR
jgi:oligopeptide transport system substrate-binding protein